MFIVLLSVFLPLVGVNIWVEPSWVSTNLDTPSSFASIEAYLYGAKHEEESFQIHIAAENEDINDLYYHLAQLPKPFSSPDVYFLLPIEGIPLPQGGVDKSFRFLEVLKPLDKPIYIPRKQKLVLWVTWKIPKEAKSDVYALEIQLTTEGKRLKRIPVTIEVFDFELPSTPSLPAVGFLDWKALGALQTTRDPQGLDWNSVFNHIYRKRLLVSLGKYSQSSDKSPDPVPTSLWEQFIQSNQVSGKTYLDVAPLLLPPGPLDTVRTPTDEEFSIWKKLEDNKSTRLVAILFTPDQFSAFEPVKKYLNALAEQTPSILRLLCGLPFPQFNYHTDIWAIPHAYYNPHLIDRFMQGQSIAEVNTLPVKSVTASSCGYLPGKQPHMLASPSWVVDGCEFLGWISLPASKEEKNEWIEIQLRSAVVGHDILIIWGHNQTPRTVNVSISKDGSHFVSTTTQWKHTTGIPFEFSRSLGKFKYAPEFVAVRLEFPKVAKNEIVAIQEVRINATEQLSEPRIAPVIKPWLLLTAETFPSLRYDAPPIEARIIPWLCWNCLYHGIVLTPLNAWGNIITKSRSGGQFLFSPQTSLETTSLLFPDPDTGYLSSVRLERLRDGLEDYEYLVMLANKARSEKLKNENLQRLLISRPERLLPWNLLDENTPNQLINDRIAIGYELSGKSITAEKSTSKPTSKKPTVSTSGGVKKNFKGRSEPPPNSDFFQAFPK